MPSVKYNKNVTVRSSRNDNEYSFLQSVQRGHWNAADIYLNAIRYQKLINGTIPHTSVLIDLLSMHRWWCDVYPSPPTTLTDWNQGEWNHPLEKLTAYVTDLRLLGADPNALDKYGESPLSMAQKSERKCPHNKEYLKKVVDILKLPLEQVPGFSNDTIHSPLDSEASSKAPSLHANYLIGLTGIAPAVTTIMQLSHMAASAGVRLITGVASTAANVTQVIYQPNTASNPAADDADNGYNFAVLGTLCGLSLGAYLFSTIKTHSGSISSFFKKNNPSYQAESFTKKLN